MQAQLTCMAVNALSSEPNNRIYDLALQPPWQSDPGGSWLAAISHTGTVGALLLLCMPGLMI